MKPFAHDCPILEFSYGAPGWWAEPPSVTLQASAVTAKQESPGAEMRYEVYVGADHHVAVYATELVSVTAEVEPLDVPLAFGSAVVSVGAGKATATMKGPGALVVISAAQKAGADENCWEWPVEAEPPVVHGPACPPGLVVAGEAKKLTFAVCGATVSVSCIPSAVDDSVAVKCTVAKPPAPAYVSVVNLSGAFLAEASPEALQQAAEKLVASSLAASVGSPLQMAAAQASKAMKATAAQMAMTAAEAKKLADALMADTFSSLDANTLASLEEKYGPAYGTAAWYVARAEEMGLCARIGQAFPAAGVVTVALYKWDGRPAEFEECGAYWAAVKDEAPVGAVVNVVPLTPELAEELDAAKPGLKEFLATNTMSASGNSLAPEQWDKGLAALEKNAWKVSKAFEGGDLLWTPDSEAGPGQKLWEPEANAKAALAAAAQGKSAAISVAAAAPGEFAELAGIKVVESDLVPSGKAIFVAGGGGVLYVAKKVGQLE